MIQIATIAPRDPLTGEFGDPVPVYRTAEAAEDEQDELSARFFARMLAKRLNGEGLECATSERRVAL